LAFEPYDVCHASQHEQKTASETDREHARQSTLQAPEFRYQDLIGMLESLSIPCPQCSGPIQDLFLQRAHAVGDQALGLVPALIGRRCEDGYIESSLLSENILHSVQERRFCGIAISGVTFQIGVDFNGQPIELLAGRLPIGLLFGDELLNGIVVALLRKAISPKASACALPGHARRPVAERAFR